MIDRQLTHRITEDLSFFPTVGLVGIADRESFFYRSADA
jgi:hypothetical protein